MGRIEKLKREAIQEANKRNLGIIDENHAGFSLGFANNGGLTVAEESEIEYEDKDWLVVSKDDEDTLDNDLDETTLSQEFNDDNEGDEDEVDTDQIEEQDDVPLDEIT